MRSWKSLGPTQRRLLIAARHEALHLTRPSEIQAGLKLHTYGFLDRGHKSVDFTINEKGMELSHGKEE